MMNILPRKEKGEFFEDVYMWSPFLFFFERERRGVSWNFYGWDKSDT
jgi:hypothetical protein